jgi:hypothetical protein
MDGLGEMFYIETERWDSGAAGKFPRPLLIPNT